MKKRVVITGIGIIAPCGTDKEVLWDSVLKGKTFTSTSLTLADASLPVKIACEIKNLEKICGLPPRTLMRLDRQGILSLVSAKAAIEDSKLNIDDDLSFNTGVFEGTALASINTNFERHTKYLNEGLKKISPLALLNGLTGNASAMFSQEFKIHGPARPDEILFCVFMDYTNCTNNIHISELSLPGGTLPLGVEIQQLAFAFNLPGLTDMFFMKWKIINKSSNTWDSTYVSIVDDADLGYSGDDAAGCDSLRETGFIYNANNIDQMYGAAPPAIGYRLLQSPMVYTGNPNDTARLPYGTYIGYKLIRLTGYNVFVNGGGPCTGDPDIAEAAYNFMKGQDGCGNPLFNFVTGRPTKFKYSGNACSHTGWYDSNSTDRRQILSSGQITMHSADTQIIVTSTVIARGTSNFQSVCDLLFWSDFAKRFYDSNFLIVPPIGITNISSDVPNSFSLSQNYPNPFNPVTKIRFAIASVEAYPRTVRLVIYDVLGREVATLVNEQLQPGTYEVDWDAASYSNGVYFYTLQTETFSETKRMVLIK